VRLGLSSRSPIVQRSLRVERGRARIASTTFLGEGGGERQHVERQQNYHTWVDCRCPEVIQKRQHNGVTGGEGARKKADHFDRQPGTPINGGGGGAGARERSSTN